MSGTSTLSWRNQAWLFQKGLHWRLVSEYRSAEVSCEAGGLPECLPKAFAGIVPCQCWDNPKVSQGLQPHSDVHATLRLYSQSVSADRFSAQGTMLDTMGVRPKLVN